MTVWVDGRFDYWGRDRLDAARAVLSADSVDVPPLDQAGCVMLSTTDPFSGRVTRERARRVAPMDGRRGRIHRSGLGSGHVTSRPRLRPPTLVAVAVVALVPFVVLRLKRIPVDDPDSFWHVLSGQHVWRTHEVVVDDPFGRFSTNPWVQIDWLSDLAMAGVHAVAGLAGVAWLFATLGILLFVALYVAARRSAPPLTAGIVATIGWAGPYREPGVPPADRVLRAPRRHARRLGPGAPREDGAAVVAHRPQLGLGVPATACGSSVPSWAVTVVLGLAIDRVTAAPGAAHASSRSPSPAASPWPGHTPIGPRAPHHAAHGQRLRGAGQRVAPARTSTSRTSPARWSSSS